MAGKEEKTLTFENKDAIYTNKSYSFCLNQSTYYNEENQKVEISASGELGFYINDEASGYYVVDALIYTSTSWFNLKISNNFSFVKSYDVNLKVSDFYIDDLTNYTEVCI